MHAIVSILPEPYFSKIAEIWENLKNNHALNKVEAEQYPHLSWQIAQDYHFSYLEEKMKIIANNHKPIKIQTSGIGIFTGKTPVIYIPVVKTKELHSFQSMQWETITPKEERKNFIYAPENWVPHISIAFSGVTKRNIGKIVKYVAFMNFDWEFELDNFSLIYCRDSKIGELKYRFSFKG